MKKLIKNGTIVLEDKVIQGDLLIEDEVIAEIGQNLDAEADRSSTRPGWLYCLAVLMCIHTSILMLV